MEKGSLLIELLLLVACCALLAAAVVLDLLHRKVPNLIPLGLLGLFVIQIAVVGHRDMTPLWAHFATGVVLLAVGFVLFLMGALGAGDGKLMASAALWVGPEGIGSFLLGVGLLGLAMASICLLPFEATRRLRDNMPFAVAISPPAIALLTLRAFLVAGSGPGGP